MLIRAVLFLSANHAVSIPSPAPKDNHVSWLPNNIPSSSGGWACLFLKGSNAGVSHPGRERPEHKAYLGPVSHQSLMNAERLLSLCSRAFCKHTSATSVTRTWVERQKPLLFYPVFMDGLTLSEGGWNRPWLARDETRNSPGNQSSEWSQ